MDLAPPAFADLTPEEFDRVYQTLVQRLRDLLPGADLRRGDLHDLNLVSAAVLHAALRRVLDRLWKLRSPQALLEDPEGVEAGDFDQALAFYRVSRRPAVRAAGAVAVVGSSSVPLTFAAGFRFTSAAGLDYQLPAAVVLTDDDLERLALGRYRYTLAVEAVDAGTLGNLAAGSALTPSAPLAGLVGAHASAGLAGGRDRESNTQVLTRLLAGAASPGSGDRNSLEALLRATEGLDGLVAISAVRSGDPEQRSGHSLLPIAVPASADVYLKVVPALAELLLTATFLQDTARGGLWQASLGRDDAPGFYEVDRLVRRADDPDSVTGLAVALDTRGLDLTGLDRPPDLEAAAEGAYSRYQTAVVQFLDPDTPTAGLAAGDTAAYRAYVLAAPGLALAQAAVDAADAAPLLGEILLRAAVPCLVSFNATVHRPAAADDPDTGALAAALVDLVNGQGFVGELPAALLTAKLLELLPVGWTVTDPDLLGRLRRPDGTYKALRSRDRLAVPDEPERGVTVRTAAFFLDASRVGLSVAGDL